MAATIMVRTRADFRCYGNALRALAKQKQERTVRDPTWVPPRSRRHPGGAN
jgi:hypothetical protein